MMHLIKQASIILALTASVLLSATPAKADGLCYKVQNPRPTITKRYGLQAETGSTNSWYSVIEPFGITQKVSLTPRMSMMSSKLDQRPKHRHVIILEYPNKGEDWLFLDAGDYCNDMAPGQQVSIPSKVFVAQIIE